ncbi:hypothetical protein F4824DRAFT_495953 [Ustulina deusta]|nr:hypothetical protein F4824DRAFT_495953 [Ustulina deusta]
MQCAVASDFLPPNQYQVPEPERADPLDGPLWPNVAPNDLLNIPPLDFADPFAPPALQDYQTPIDPALDIMFPPEDVGNASSLGPTLEDLLGIPVPDLGLPDWNLPDIPDVGNTQWYIPAASPLGDPSQPGQPVADPYPASPLQLPSSQPSQPWAVPSPLSFQNLQPPAGQPNQPATALSPLSYQNPQLAVGQPNNFEPVLSDDLPAERAGAYRIRCHTCRQFPLGDTVQSKCRWHARGGRHFGCEHCRKYGLVCIVDGAALPPNPNTHRHIPKHSRCEACKEAQSKCDRQRPCESCVQRGTACDADLAHGTVPRGAAFGVELYGYLSLMGGGPTGVNCDENERFPREYDQPGDYHIQYVRWVQGGPVPLPPGYSGPIPNPPRPNLQLRILNLPLPHQPPPRLSSRAAALARVIRAPPPHRPRRSTRTAARARAIMAPPPPPPPSVPAQPSQSSMPPAPTPTQPSQLSPTSAILLSPTSIPAAAPDQFVTRPVVIPPGVGQDEILHLSGGATTISHLPPQLMVVPSRGPTAILYDASAIQNPIASENTNLPNGHPERADVSLTIEPRPPHPNPEGTPSLQTVPDSNQIDYGIRRKPTWCIEYRGTGPCHRPTLDVCEDLTHGDSLPVCIDCDTSSRARFEPAFANISRGLRAYACGSCSEIAAQNPSHFLGKRFRVWGLPGNAFDADVGANRSISMGPPVRMTGCDCATKLLDRTLCTPHRLEHFLDIRAKAQAMRHYVASIFGRMPCPFCLNRVGVDAYSFVDEQDIPFPDIMYTCLSCLGVVVSTPATHAAIGPAAP